MDNLLKPLRDTRVLAVGILGLISGLPFMLTLSTLTFWLFEAGISKMHIGLFFIVTLPYSFKFLWAPLIDAFHLPYIGQLFGHRRSWLIFVQTLLMIALICLGHTSPEKNLLETAAWAFIVAFLSATQDIIYEAYRTEILKGPLFGYGIGISVQGYRLGLWISGAGALYLADIFSWKVSYTFMACGMVLGIVATLMSPDPKRTLAPHQTSAPLKPALSWALWSQSFRSFILRGNWIHVIVFILAYKVGDTVLNVMTPCFLRELGFSKMQIAHVAKSFGLGTMICGGLVGGVLLSRFSLQRVLIWSCLLQSVSSFLFVAQALIGKNLWFLFLSMGVENFTCGISQAALIAYFTIFCKQPHTGMHYALISSLGALSRVVLSIIAGFSADHLSWPVFYSMTGAFCLATIALLYWRPQHIMPIRQVHITQDPLKRPPILIQSIG